MGLVCVQAPGEAEALCAYLNRDNLIYGVISQDSDCFAYGAVRVFRNFHNVQAFAHPAGKIDRNHLIAQLEQWLALHVRS